MHRDSPFSYRSARAGTGVLRWANIDRSDLLLRLQRRSTCLNGLVFWHFSEFSANTLIRIFVFCRHSSLGQFLVRDVLDQELCELSVFGSRPRIRLGTEINCAFQSPKYLIRERQFRFYKFRNHDRCACKKDAMVFLCWILVPFVKLYLPRQIVGAAARSTAHYLANKVRIKRS